MESAEILKARLSRAFILHRREENLIDDWALTGPGPSVNRQLVERIVAAYGNANEGVARESMWTAFLRENAGIHGALLSRNVDEVVRAFADPGSNNLFMGFDNLYAGFNASMLASDGLKAWMAMVSYDSLVRLGEAVGALRLDNPEQYASHDPSALPVDDVLSAIDAVLGITLEFPSIYPNEVGVRSSRGVVGYRAVQAVFQAHLIAKHVARVARPRVLEIGAGLGRTAYYARKMGVVDYTIVDLPFSNTSQAHFLGTVFGSHSVTLAGEANVPDVMRVWTDQELVTCGERFDLIANVDSFTEIDEGLQGRYWDLIRRSAPTFLSINHEANGQTVIGRAKQDRLVRDFSRVPYWMRRGYTLDTIELA